VEEGVQGGKDGRADVAFGVWDGEGRGAAVAWEVGDEERDIFWEESDDLGVLRGF
jgi:hypothetical protein